MFVCVCVCVCVVVGGGGGVVVHNIAVPPSRGSTVPLFKPTKRELAKGARETQKLELQRKEAEDLW